MGASASGGHDLAPGVVVGIGLKLSDAGLGGLVKSSSPGDSSLGELAGAHEVLGLLESFDARDLGVPGVSFVGDVFASLDVDESSIDGLEASLGEGHVSGADVVLFHPNEDSTHAQKEHGADNNVLSRGHFVCFVLFLS